MKRRTFFAAITTALGVDSAPEIDPHEHDEEVGDLVVLTKEEHDALLQKV